MWGMGVIAIAAPIIAFIWPGTQVIVGAIAGGWLAVGRLILIKIEDSLTRKAAAIQEEFDRYVFMMPTIADRPQLPSKEVIASISGSDKYLLKNIDKEDLYNWYPFDINDKGLTSVALSLRTNASYSASLLKITSASWFGAVILWVLILIILSVILGLSLITFILAIFLPLASPLIELFEYGRKIQIASLDRGAMAREIERDLQRNSIQAEDLVIWQARMYDLRTSMPQVPDLIYKIRRRINEHAMKTASSELSDKNRKKNTLRNK